MSKAIDVLVVGAGHGGAQTAIALRQQKFAGSILVVGAEADIPYERPAMSKEYLAGEKPFEKLVLRPQAFWTEKNVEIRGGTRIVGIDAERHEARCEDGSTIAYRTLVWAAGGTPRRLSCGGHDVSGVHAIRDRADVDKLKSELDAATRIVVIGAGYIGLEAAAVLRKKEKHVTVLEAQDRVLSRVAGEALSRFFESEHRNHGVDLRLGVAVASLASANERGGAPGERVTGVVLASGETLPADIVVVGIGIAPAVEPLLAAGAKGADGVLVDDLCRTSLPDVYAVGDCAAHANPFANGRVVRLESIQNATDQATIAAKAIAGTLAEGERYDAVPWFWSNQYDLRLQTVGLSLVHDEVVLRGDPASRSFSVVYLDGGKVVALDCVNKTKDYVQGRALVVARREVDRAKLVDPEVTLKELAS